MLKKKHSTISLLKTRTVQLLCALLLALLIPPQITAAQTAMDPGELSSWSVARKLHELGHELAEAGKLTDPQVEQAITLFTTVIELDKTAKQTIPEMIRLISRHAKLDHSKLLAQLLLSYVDKDADLEIVREGIAYLQKGLDTREDREKSLEEILAYFGGRNKILDSDLATELGLLKAEKSDLETAKSLFIQAYYNNKYNRLAFIKLAELAADEMQPVMYLEHTRLAFGQNPLDIESAVTFAQYAESMQLYDTAADAYQYCVELFMYLQPKEPVPESLYLPWAISSYNTQRSAHKCLQIAATVRQSGRFNLLLEAIAAKAAIKIGDNNQADTILKNAEQKALAAVTEKRSLTAIDIQTVNTEQLAWFYCLVISDANKAVEWANRAYSSDPNSPDAAAILAYSLTLKGQTDSAKLLVENYPPNQIAELAMAMIQLSKLQNDNAIETLKSLIPKDPGSLAAERARDLLTEHGAEYVPSIDPELILNAIGAKSQQDLVPQFVEPGKILTVELKLGGSNFSYATNFEASIAITNNSAEPLVISNDGLFKGHIRIDAAVTGDIQADIPNLVLARIRPSSPIAPGQNYVIPVRLFTGRLAKILHSHPQAALQIEFTVFLDPLATQQGAIVNGIYGLEPTKVTARRSAVELSQKYIQHRLDSLSRGRPGLRVKSIRLFAGLLAEQQQYERVEPPYRLMTADWMPNLLKSALAQGLADNDWEIRVHTMAEMLSIQLDYELTSAVSENLTHRQWPVRLMALYLLSKKQNEGFNKVLDWTARVDNNEQVRNMAIALGAK
ncbi:MAG: tetratricopeptide repeat protein, partial [Planctomycetota bacterium]